MIEELIDFLNDISSNGDSFFIEAEGKSTVIDNFIQNYNASHRRKINNHSDGIILLNSNANKWGLELRLYVPEIPPVSLSKMFTRNTVYRSEYTYRLNDNRMISDLLERNYEIGLN